MPKKKGAPASPFVPVEEQPYPIPENWCWVKLEDISEIIMGQSPTGSDTTDDSSYIPLIGGAADMGIMYPLATRYTKVPTKISKDGDLILCIRATLGKPIFSNGEYCLGRGVAAVRPYTGPKEYYRYFFLNFEQYLYDNATGTTFAQVNSKILQKMPVPLSPRPEQQRIVTRLESLFAKLDEAKEKAQAVVDGFELRKSAVLHKAFTGELTEQWRKEHGVGLDSWKKCLIGDVFDLQAGKNISAKEISSQQTDLYRYPCFGGNGIRGYVEQFNREGEHPIIGRQGALCGNINLAYNQFYATEHAVVVSYKMDVSTLWAYHYLKFLNLNQYATATAQPGLAVSNIVKVPIQYVPLEEQQELSQILDNLLNKEQQAKEAVEAVLSQIDTMKKAILARAFRGELGTNDPAEEWAGELVKKLLSEKT